MFNKQKKFLALLLIILSITPFAITYAIPGFTDVSNSQELQAAINANENINLTADFTIDMPISIPNTYAKTIQGNNHTLTLGNNVPNMFIAQNGMSKTIFNGIIFDGQNKGKIFAINNNPSNSDFIEINGCTIKNCVSWNDNNQGSNSEGGAIYLGPNNKLKITGSTIENCKGVKPSNPPRDNMEGHGGVIFALSSQIVIEGSTFNNNSSGDGNSCGGVIFAQNTNINVSGSTFSGNHTFATRDAGGMQGGVMYINGGSITSTNNTYNVAKLFNTGGALYISGAQANIADDKYIINGLGDAFGISGGAICSEGSNTTIERSTFSINGSKIIHAGGIIDVVGGGNLRIQGSQFTGSGAWWQGPSTATFGGAIAFESGSTAVADISDTNFKNFMSDQNGGAITISTRKGERASVTLNMTGVTIDSARVRSAWDSQFVGGAIYVGPGNTLNTTNVNIYNSFAVRGGAIYNDGTLTYTNGNIKNNLTYQVGAGIYNDGICAVRGTKFANNTNPENRLYPGKNKERIGGHIYANKDVTIGQNTEFGNGQVGTYDDVRVIDNKSAIVLEAPLTHNIPVSISETEGGSGVYNENAHRHIGYIASKSNGTYIPTVEDAKKLLYNYETANTAAGIVSPAADHESIGKWDFVLNDNTKNIVLGQRASVTYHVNSSDAHFEDNSSEKNILYTLFNDEAPYSLPVEKQFIEDIPIRNNFSFVNWYGSEAEGKPDLAMNTGNTPFNVNNISFLHNREEGKNIIPNNHIDLYAVYDESFTVTVKKEWATNIKEASVKVGLFLNGSPLNKELVLNEENNYQGSFSNLLDSEDINSYSVKELDKNNQYHDQGNLELGNKTYNLSIVKGTPQGNTVNFTLTNEYVVPTKSITVTKRWDAPNNMKAPVQAQLYKNGTATEEIIDLNSSNNWQGSFTNLPAEDAATAANINYSIKEVGESDSKITLNNNSFTVTYSGTDNIEILNTYVPAKKNIRLNLVWKDMDIRGNVSDLAAEFIPASTDIKLLANDSDHESVNFDNNTFTHTFNDVLVYDNEGNPITYSVKELGLGADNRLVNGDDKFNVSITSEGDTFTVTNTRLPKKLSLVTSNRAIKVTKVWKDSANNVIPAVTDVKVDLLNGEEVVSTLTITNNGTFGNIPAEVNGRLVEYTVRENNVEDSVFTFGNDKYDVSISGNMAEGFTITNKKIMMPEVITPTARKNIKVKKIWLNENDTALSSALTPESVDIEVYVNNNLDRVLTLNAGNNWQDGYSIANTDENGNENVVTVKERNENNNKVVINNKEFDVSIDKVSGIYNITNKYVPETKNIIVNLVWKDMDIRGNVSDLAAEFIPASTDIKLLANDSDHESVSFDSNTFTHTFNSILVYDNDGNPITYSVKELGLGTDNRLVNGDDKFNVSITSEGNTFTVTNTRLPKKLPLVPSSKAIQVKKIWLNEAGAALSNALTPESVDIEVYVNNNLDRVLTLNAENNWQDGYSISIVDSNGNENVVTVKERNESDNKAVINNKEFDVSINKVSGIYNITNKYVPETKNIIVNLVWKDMDIRGNISDLASEFIPASTDIKLLANDSDHESVSFDNNTFTHTFENVSVLDNEGNQITYSVKELGLDADNRLVNGDDKFNVSITSEGNTFTVTNTRLPKKLPLVSSNKAIKVKKLWLNESGTALNPALIPNSTDIEVYINNSLDRVLTLNAANNWQDGYSISSVNSDGAENVVTVKERNESDNKVVIENKEFDVNINKVSGVHEITNKYIPATQNIILNLVWKDMDIRGNVSDLDAEFIPASTDIKLLSNDSDYESVNFDNNTFTHTFENVLVLDNEGNQITYSVKELGLGADNRLVNGDDKFNVSITSEGNIFTVTNTRLPKKLSLVSSTRAIKVTKVWQDPEGNVIPAVTDVEVELLNGDDVVSTLTITNNGTFGNIPADVNGRLVEYTVRENNVEDSVFTFGNDKYDVSISGDMRNGFTITNKKIMRPEIITPNARKNIQVKKIWLNDAGNALAPALIPESTDIEVYVNNNLDRVLTLNAGNNWQDGYSIANTDENGNENVVTIKESNESNNRVTIDNKDYNVSINKVSGVYKVTNKYIVPEETLDITVKKRWQRAESTPVEIALLKNGEEIDSVILDDDNEWKHVFTSLPVYENGRKIKYTVNEIGEDGELKDGWLNKYINGIWYKVRIEKLSNTFIITNATPSEATPSIPGIATPSIPDRPDRPYTPDRPHSSVPRVPVSGGNGPGVVINKEPAQPDITVPENNKDIVPVQPATTRPIPKTGNDFNIVIILFMLFTSILSTYAVNKKINK